LITTCLQVRVKAGFQTIVFIFKKNVDCSIALLFKILTKSGTKFSHFERLVVNQNVATKHL
jgi:hypothetical protein